MSSAWDFPVAIATRRSPSASSSVRYTDVFLIPYVGYHPPDALSTATPPDTKLAVRCHRLKGGGDIPADLHLPGARDAGYICPRLASQRAQCRVCGRGVWPRARAAVGRP